jgi:predicted deacetylase
LLVVPRYHHAASTPAFEQWLTAAHARGDELALHGLTHLDEQPPSGFFDRARRSWYTAGEGEFSTLSREEAMARMQTGIAWFRAHGWPLHGFVAPAWLMSPGTWEALADTPFRYTCTLARITALPGRASLRSQSIVYSTRSAWRRVVSNRWNAAVAWKERDQPLLRFELHPGDLAHASVRASWMRLLERALRDRTPVTLAEAAGRIA